MTNLLRRMLFVLLALAALGGALPPAPAKAQAALAKAQAALAADVERQTLFPVLIEGESALLEVELRNTGTETWNEGSDRLVNTKNPYGDKSEFALQQSIAPGDTTLIAWRTQVFNTPGVYTTEWQLRRGDTDIEGGFLRFTVVVLPKALEEKRDELQQQIADWTAEQVDNIEALITAWIKEQIENAAQDARRQICGNPVVIIFAVLAFLARAWWLHARGG
jgi:hypothetical protein